MLVITEPCMTTFLQHRNGLKFGQDSVFQFCHQIKGARNAAKFVMGLEKDSLAESKAQQ